MINTEELLVSNKSATRKDFASIYPELLDLAKRLTNRWDPEVSNESDPGVVLLKLAAFIADKENYNIDKNTLECFMPSATQKSSMQALCEAGGYAMKYYRSAVCDVSFTYVGDELLTDGSKSFILPKYTTTIVDVSNNVTYTLLEDVTVSIANTIYTAVAIEGTIADVTVGDSTTIQSHNLDDNFRIYLPSYYSAYNGTFITNVNDSELWERVDNLNDKQLGNKIFKFGFDSSKQKCYIQFPSDIHNLIGNGLNIKYTVSSGRLGNIAAMTLSKLGNNNSRVIYIGGSASDTTIDLTDTLIVSNLESTSGGADPETVEEAYNSFKKIAGTFDTLVTTRDYANWIYNWFDEYYNNSVVSNIQAADKRNDINYSNRFMSVNEYGSYKANRVDLLPSTSSEGIKPYEICIYPLNPSKSNDQAAYEDSFKVYNQQSQQNLWDDFCDETEDVKCIAIERKELQDTDLYLIKNYYTLNTQIYTYNKVSKTDQLDIISNVKSALYYKFNSRQLDYGYEIPYDTLRDTIMNADTRIKNIDLPEPTLTTKYMLKDGTEAVLDATTSQFVNIAVRNVLEGKISLFDEIGEFNFEFGQSNYLNSEGIVSSEGIIENIKYVTTETIIPAGPTSEGWGGSLYDLYQIRDNEMIQITAPKLVSVEAYSGYVNYCWQPDMSSGSAATTELWGTGTSAGQTDITDQASFLNAKNWCQTNNYKLAYISGTISGATGGYHIDSVGNKYTIAGNTIEYVVPSGGGSPVAQTYYVMLTEGSDGTDWTLKKNVAHKLTGNETLYINYVDQSDWTHNITYTATGYYNNGKWVDCQDGVIIKPNFDMARTTSDSSSTITYVGSLPYITMSSDQEIDRMQVAKIKLSNSNLPCYWFMNNEDNILFDATKPTEKVITLQNGEYFIYTNSSYTELNILGAGTRLELGTINQTWKINRSELISIDDIITDGVKALKLNEWFNAKLASNPLTIVQMEITSLGSGCVCGLGLLDSSNTFVPASLQSDLTNTYIDMIEATTNKPLYMKYVDGDGNQTLVEPRTTGDLWQIRSNLIINAGPSSPQEILNRQKVIIMDKDKNVLADVQKYANTGKVMIEFSNLFQRMGGENVDLTSLYKTGEELERLEENGISAYVYVSNPVKNASGEYITTNNYGELNITGNDFVNGTTFTSIDLPVLTSHNCDYHLFSLNWLEASSDGKLILDSNVTNGLQIFDGVSTTWTQTLTFDKAAGPLYDGMYTIAINKGVTNIKATFTTTNTDIKDVFVFGKQKIGEDINPSLYLTASTILPVIKARTTDTDGRNLFDYCYSVNNAYAVNNDDLLDPECYWDKNNIANRMTLPEIDFNSSTIQVAKSSRL